MLQGGKVVHTSVPGVWLQMTDNRRIVVGDSVFEFTDEFLHFSQYAEGWESYDSTSR
nr:MAG TPA: hypothetical protein [Caudoviricetes sp.]